MKYLTYSLLIGLILFSGCTKDPEGNSPSDEDIIETRDIYPIQGAWLNLNDPCEFEFQGIDFSSSTDRCSYGTINNRIEGTYFYEGGDEVLITEDSGEITTVKLRGFTQLEPIEKMKITLKGCTFIIERL